MSIFKKKAIAVSVLILVLVIVGGIMLYATGGLQNTMNEQLTTLFKTTTRLTRTFNNEESRYLIKYPVDWEFDQSSPGTVVFSGREGTLSYFSTVNIQVVLTKATGGEYNSVEKFMDDIKKQVKQQSPDATFLGNGPIEIKEKEGGVAKGEYMIFTYNYSGQIVKQWQIVVLRSDKQVFYAWAYTSTTSRYDDDLLIAKEMLASWVIY